MESLQDFRTNETSEEKDVVPMEIDDDEVEGLAPERAIEDSITTLVVDTNVAISEAKNLKAISSVQNKVVVCFPLIVVQELDRLKTLGSDDVQHRARIAIRWIHDCLRHPSSTGAKVIVERRKEAQAAQKLMQCQTADEKILACCLYLQDQTRKNSMKIVLVTNDINLSNLAMLSDIAVETSGCEHFSFLIEHSKPARDPMVGTETEADEEKISKPSQADDVVKDFHLGENNKYKVALQVFGIMERALGRKSLISLLDFEDVALEPADWEWKTIASLMESPSVREELTKGANISVPSYAAAVKSFQRACTAKRSAHLPSKESQDIRRLLSILLGDQAHQGTESMAVDTHSDSLEAFEDLSDQGVGIPIKINRRRKGGSASDLFNVLP